MPEDNEQPSQEKSSEQGDKTSDASNDSLPLNQTPPAPKEKTTEANFTESCEGMVIFVQAEGDCSRQDDE
jgi:hypothetical protein